MTTTTPAADGYSAPAITDLGDLAQVQAGNGYYYDGPATTWLRWDR